MKSSASIEATGVFVEAGDAIVVADADGLIRGLRFLASKLGIEALVAAELRAFERLAACDGDASALTPATAVWIRQYTAWSKSSSPPPALKIRLTLEVEELPAAETEDFWALRAKRVERDSR